MAYSITSRTSFEELESWKRKIDTVHEGRLIPLILVGTHCDQEEQRQLTQEEVTRLAAKWGCRQYLASARTRWNIVEVFNDLVREMRKSNVYD